MVQGGHKRVAQRCHMEKCDGGTCLIDTVRESELMVEEGLEKCAGGRVGDSLTATVEEGVGLAVADLIPGYGRWRGRSWICGQT